ncbi:hypothetical protein [Rhizobium sp. L1K21]|uniref:hypothetical protein n=1 Tax=Rhizobium sp. L1K21 TaxID=2954933 RepID=UPI0020926223|nr:hypothetical protein [Rhizobium sp. L1K21]MCO6187841.1 hypothetical protein [Rhizobium sp. L1K21]
MTRKTADIPADRAADKSPDKPIYPDQGRHLESIEPDDVPNNDARRKAARKGTDTFLVEADLEDMDQDHAATADRDQDDFNH